MRPQHYPSGARHMPLENDFTRVFGAIKELEERVEALELRATVEDDGTEEWHTYGKPDYRSLFVSEQIEVRQLRERLAEETDKRRDAEATVINLRGELEITNLVFRRDLIEAEREYNQLRFILSILAAVKDDGWIEWHGGECPVGGLAMIDFKLRNGEIWSGKIPIDLTWEHGCGPHDIIAYRIAR